MKIEKIAPSLSFAVLSALISACANPTATIQPDIERFKRDFPEHIQTFQGKNRTIKFAWSGDSKKRPLLFVHGSPGSWEGWAHFLLDPELQRNFQVFAVDRPGFGGSESGNTERSLSVQAADILEVLDFNQSGERAILVGHSFGGPVIARAAIDHPEKVAGLVFVASSVDPELEKTKWIQYPATWWPIRILIPTALRVCNEEILPLKGELITMLPEWKKIFVPVSVIQGEDDDLVPPANVDFLTKNLPPNSIIETRRIPGLNHFVPWKRPDLILEGIRAVEKCLVKPLDGCDDHSDKK
jgi:pimeloyl-ACP methyl ester carboxylesterase